MSLSLFLECFFLFNISISNLSTKYSIS